jgi:hypothetical protein
MFKFFKNHFFYNNKIGFLNANIFYIDNGFSKVTFEISMIRNVVITKKRNLILNYLSIIIAICFLPLIKDLNSILFNFFIFFMIIFFVCSSIYINLVSYDLVVFFKYGFYKIKLNTKEVDNAFILLENLKKG